MKRNVAYAFVSLLLIVAPATAGDDSLRNVLQSRYAEIKKAMAAHDGAGLQAILAPDFRSVDISGQSETGPEMIAEVNALKPDPNRWSETILVKIDGSVDAATVEQRYRMKTVKVAAGGTSHKVEMITLSTNT